MENAASKPRNLPIDSEMISRLHECGGEELQAQLVYVLSVCLDDRERWMARAFKRPSELTRWVLAGRERWGLAPEFEPMRRLERCDALGMIVNGAGGRVNESLRARIGHVRSMAMILPSFDHLYWGVFVAVVIGGLWGGHAVGEWVESAFGWQFKVGFWLAESALLAAMLKGSVYVWQDSSSSMAEGLKVLVWGRSPQEDAINLMSKMERLVGFDDSLALVEPTASPDLARKSKQGRLSPLEALEVARLSKEAKEWRANWTCTQDRLSELGAAAIFASKQPGWARSQLESVELGQSFASCNRPLSGDFDENHGNGPRRL